MATLWDEAHCFKLKSNSEYNYENTIKKIEKPNETKKEMNKREEPQCMYEILNYI